MFQKKINELFKDLSNVLGITDDTLIVGYDDDGTIDDRTLCRFTADMQKRKLKFSKDKCHFKCTSNPFLQNYSRYGVIPDPCMLKAPTKCHHPNKRNLQAFLDIIYN